MTWLFTEQWIKVATLHNAIETSGGGFGCGVGGNITSVHFVFY